ncbi:MAG TPA: sulfite exporter TauE/SafE family protein [Vicinamibacterales bacterium]
MEFWIELTLLALAGVVAGALNVVAGGGSFLILPALLFVGLPASLANGTNRVGVLAQNAAGILGFHQHGAMDWSWSLKVSIPAVLGACLGVWAALIVPDFAFRRILSIAMVVFTVWSLLNRQQPARRDDVKPASHWVVVLGFFIVGLYGGFIQAGVGFLVLAITTYAGMDLVRGNAVKLLSVMMLTLISLIVFAGAGQVDWPRGFALAVGNWIGAVAGVRMAVLKGHKWLQQVVTVTVVLFAIALWFQ